MQLTDAAPHHILAGGRVTASPYAKKLARDAGVDISDATPSGLGGRIVAADIEQLIKSGAINKCKMSCLPLGTTWAVTVKQTKVRMCGQAWHWKKNQSPMDFACLRQSCTTAVRRGTV